VHQPTYLLSCSLCAPNAFRRLTILPFDFTVMNSKKGSMFEIHADYSTASVEVRIVYYSPPSSSSCTLHPHLKLSYCSRNCVPRFLIFPRIHPTCVMAIFNALFSSTQLRSIGAPYFYFHYLLFSFSSSPLFLLCLVVFCF
jgi:hypothetical protein